MENGPEVPRQRGPGSHEFDPHNPTEHAGQYTFRNRIGAYALFYNNYTENALNYENINWMSDFEEGSQGDSSASQEYKVKQYRKNGGKSMRKKKKKLKKAKNKREAKAVSKARHDSDGNPEMAEEENDAGSESSQEEDDSGDKDDSDDYHDDQERRRGGTSSGGRDSS